MAKALGGWRGFRGFWRLLVVATALYVPVAVARPFDPAPTHTESTGPGTTVPENKEILFLSGRQYGLPIVDAALKGILDALKDGGLSVNDFFVEYLDLIRTPDTEHRAIMAQMLRQKLKDKHVGIIIAEGPTATDFLEKEGKDLFPNAARLSILDTPRQTEGMTSHPTMNVIWNVDPARTLQAAEILFPNTRHVLVITGAHDAIQPFLEDAKKAFAPWENRLTFQYTNDMTYEDMLQSVKSQPKDSIIIYSPFFSDTTGRAFVPIEVIDRITEVTTVPVFATLDTYLGHGIIGGALLKTASIGTIAGKLALAYISGNLKIAAPATNTSIPTALMFDWKEIERWHGDAKLLPKDSLFINRQLTVFEQYRNAILLTIAVIVALSILSVALIFENLRRRRLEMTARESEERFRVLIEHAPEAIFVYDVDLGRILIANARTATLFGCSMERLLEGGPERFYQVTQPDGDPIRDSIERHNRQALAGDEPVFTRAIQSDNGRQALCEVRLVRLPAAHKRLLRATFIDMTEHEQAKAKIQAERDRAQRYLDTVEAVIVSLDTAGTITLINRKGCTILGYAEAELLGRNWFTTCLPAAESDAIYRSFKVIVAGKYDTMAEYRENAIIDRAGQVVMIAWHNTLLLDQQGTVIGTLSAGEDITERKKAEGELLLHKNHLEAMVLERTAALEIALTRAEAANRAKSAFLANMSHELRTPLTSIIGFSELMADDPDLKPGHQRNLAIINRAGTHLLTLINDVLELSKIEAGRAAISEEITDLNTMIKEVIEMIGIRAAQKELTLTVESTGLPSGLCVDAIKLRQVLLNLLSNAVKFTEQGVITLALSGHPQGTDHVRIDVAVSDTGVGIAPEDRARVFDPFVQLGGGYQQTGTGLGLSISRQFVRMMGSDITIESAPGYGTTFRFSFTATVCTQVEPLPHPTCQVVGIKSGDPIYRILIAEDNDDTRTLLRALLAPLGFALTEVSDGFAALEMVNTAPPDLVIMDWRMPLLDGLEATRRIRALDPAHQPRIVMLTASAFEEERAIALAAGVDDFLRKPFSPNALNGYPFHSPAA